MLYAPAMLCLNKALRNMGGIWNWAAKLPNGPRARQTTLPPTLAYAREQTLKAGWQNTW